MYTRICSVFFLLAAGLSAWAQPAEYKMTREEYVSKYRDDAVKEMLMHGVPASITLAQGMLESANGNSALAVYANNHFGIKCHDDWSGMTYIQDDDETNECFRKYNTVLESYSDHSQFLLSRERYTFLFQLKVTDYKGWAYGLASAGYATDPGYAVKLIDIIETFRLYELDKMVMMPEKQTKVDFNDRQPRLDNANAPKVIVNNNTKCVIAKTGDTYAELAKALGMSKRRLRRYNEVDRNAKLRTGDFVYIETKKKKAQQEFYTVKKGDTIHSIAQRFGVRQRSLLRLNNMSLGQEPGAGQKLYLKERKKN